MQRRRFIRLAGGGLVAAAVAGPLAACSAFEVPPGAVAAWQPPAADTELRRWLLAHALLAPNPHNMQPWLADLRTPGEITLRLDPQRLLPATDPYGRQILMGAGAFLELLLMAAAERGQRAELALFPDGEPAERLDGRAFARVRLAADAGVPRDPLFAQVLRRRTDRRAYDPARPPSVADGQALQAAAAPFALRFGLAGSTAADAPRLQAIRTIAREAWRLELTTEAPMMESMKVLRIGAAEIDRHRDGITITRPLLVALARTGLFDRSRFPAPDSQATQGQIDEFDAVTAATPAYLWLVSEGNRRAQQVDAGRAYVRVNLAGSAVGLAMHPNQQSLQEYPEVAGPYRAIHELLGAPAPKFTVQMLARVGHLPAGTAAQPPAPRRGLARQFGA
ncbi:MAG: twin-arginine translocation pathway signal protein [Burkholderiaceae bacterium]|nr:twin-arginine translocation pathway signal protein [Burkholderiaceae bacterium]